MRSCLKALLPLAAASALLAGPAAAQDDPKPPFADGPDATKEAAPKPASRSWTVDKGGYSYAFSFEPGIPDPNQTITIMLDAAQIPKTPNPRYGNRVPLEDTRIIVVITNPSREVVARQIAQPLPLSKGKFGLHFTATQEGIYTLTIEGTHAGKALDAEVKLPVAVWPLPKELEGSGDATTTVGRSVIRRPLGK